MQHGGFNTAPRGTVAAYALKIQIGVCCLLVISLHAFTPYCFLAQP